ncbi:unnamed protein product [Heligmosomoides polygyrus]|uniref:Uncharacterized protein n=1 Tax=Heligmosomoides polygyrus TaxID=6339 RepID=A0A183GCD1_HELPZ|nr:unnamed protein product [Heligmosomoides polygyrus]
METLVYSEVTSNDSITQLPSNPAPRSFSKKAQVLGKEQEPPRFYAGKSFNERIGVKRAVEDWIASRSSSFWRNETAALPDRRRKIVATDGDYCEE